MTQIQFIAMATASRVITALNLSFQAKTAEYNREEQVQKNQKALEWIKGVQREVENMAPQNAQQENKIWDAAKQVIDENRDRKLFF